MGAPFILINRGNRIGRGRSRRRALAGRGLTRRIALRLALGDGRLPPGSNISLICTLGPSAWRDAKCKRKRERNDARSLHEKAPSLQKMN